MSNASSLLPGRNPSGTTLSADYSLLPATGSSSGANPVLPPTNLPSGAPASNPYAPGSVVPTFGANSGGYTSTNLAAPGAGAGGSNPITGSATSRQTGRTLGELQSIYGEGLGNMLYQFLQGGAGFNQAAINNLFAAMQPGVNRGEQDLMQQFSTSGNRFGSGAQIGLADYLSQVNLNQGQLETQMYEQSIQNYMNVLMGTADTGAKLKAASPGIMDTLSPLMSMIGGGASGAASSGAAGSGSLQTIMSIIGPMMMGMCWVAAELYGSWFAPETISIRGWLLRTWYMAPFVAVYRKYGKRWAGLIRRNAVARSMTKKLFDTFLRMAR
jgi:hypothetical protein